MVVNRVQLLVPKGEDKLAFIILGNIYMQLVDSLI